MRKNIKSQQNEFTNLLIEIFGKNKKVDGIIGNSIHTLNGIVNLNIRHILNKDGLAHTCSMEELTGSDDFSDYIENLIYDLQEDNIRVSRADMLRITQFLFEEWCMDNLRYSTSVIFNVVKGDWMQLTLSKCKDWKKVFEYEGNGGTVCTYMWKTK